MNLRNTLHITALIVCAPILVSACDVGFNAGDGIDLNISGWYPTPIPGTADEVRGGLLYDKWWVVNQTAAPTGDHALYPNPVPSPGNQRTGADTFRCKECHGWDYMGKDGAYHGDPGGSSHYTNIAGIIGTADDDPGLLFQKIKTGVGAHLFPALTDNDIWDLVAFIKMGAIDTTAWINPDKTFVNVDATAGAGLYAANCQSCHDADGNGAGAPAIWVGDDARGNPWEVLHKIRWGHPGSLMPSMVVNGLTDQQMADILAHAQTLASAP